MFVRLWSKPLLQPCQLSSLQHLQLPPLLLLLLVYSWIVPTSDFTRLLVIVHTSTRLPTRQDRTTSLRHLRHQFQFQFLSLDNSTRLLVHLLARIEQSSSSSSTSEKSSSSSPSEQEQVSLPSPIQQSESTFNNQQESWQYVSTSCKFALVCPILVF